MEVDSGSGTGGGPAGGAVPEPGTFLVALAGLAGLAALRLLTGSR